MSSMELINLYNMMSAIISPVTSSTSVLFKLIVLEVFIEYKNLVLRTYGLAISSHIITDNTQTI